MNIENVSYNNELDSPSRRRAFNVIHPVNSSHFGSSYNFALGLQTNDYKTRRKIKKTDLTKNDIFENTIAQAPTSTEQKIIFKYDTTKKEYSKTDFKSRITENEISENDCDKLFQFLAKKDVEIIDTKYLDDNKCMYITTIILLVIFFNVLS